MMMYCVEADYVDVLWYCMQWHSDYYDMTIDTIDGENHYWWYWYDAVREPCCMTVFWSILINDIDM